MEVDFSPPHCHHATLPVPTVVDDSCHRGGNTHRSFQLHNHHDHHFHPGPPLEAVVVDDEMTMTHAEPVMLTAHSTHVHPHAISSQQCQPPLRQAQRHSLMSSASSPQSLCTHLDRNKVRRTLVLLSLACVAVLVVIILVLAMVVYSQSEPPSLLSASRGSDHTLMPSLAPSREKNITIAPYTWHPVADCGMGSAVAISSDGRLLATVELVSAGAKSEAVVCTYLIDGRSCVPLGGDINAIAVETAAPLALTGNGYSEYTLAFGTSVANHTSGAFAMYKLNKSSWDRWGETITAWTSTTTRQETRGWSVAMSSNGMRIATGVVANVGPNRTSGGHVSLFQYNRANDEWVVMGNIIKSQDTDSIYSWSVHLSDDGTTLAVGAMLQSSNNNESSGSLRVQVYQWNQTDWYPMGSAFVGPCDLVQNRGNPVALSDDGQVLAQSMNGRVQVLRYNGSDWNPIGNSIYGDDPAALSGVSLALADGGRLLAVGMPEAGEAGVVWVLWYDFDMNEWRSVGNITATPFGNEYFGVHVDMTVTSVIDEENGAVVVLAVGSELLQGTGSGHVLMFTAHDDKNDGASV